MTKRLARDARRQSILDGARKLASKKGFQGMTTAALAKMLGVTEPVLYRHFKSKDDLFRSLLQDVVSSLTGDLERLALAEADPIEKLRSMAAAYPSLANERAESFDLIHRSLAGHKDEKTRSLLRAHYETYETMLVPLIREAQRRDAVRKDIPARTVAWHLMHTAIGFLMTQSLGSEAQEQKSFQRDLAELAIAGILNH